jgi:hypothetical protein
LGTKLLALLGRAGPDNRAHATVCTFLLHRLRFPPCDHQPRDLALFPLPLSLRIVEEMLATRDIVVSYETVRQ